MPTAPVDNNGTELYYEDTGDVPGSTDYTTLVIYHGSAFTGSECIAVAAASAFWLSSSAHMLLDTFHKLNPLGAANNIRLVILNRRDYAGSTKYTDENLKDLNAGDKSFMERLGLEVAFFLLWFAAKHDIPKISLDVNREASRSWVGL